MRKLKPSACAVHVFMMIGCIVLFAIRGVHVYRPDIVVVNPEITSHISNFALSLVLCAFIGFVLLTMGTQRSLVLAVCLAVLVANVVYEAFLPFLNTKDMIDAVYGIAGSLVGGLYLCWLDRFGFQF